MGVPAAMTTTSPVAVTLVSGLYGDRRLPFDDLQRQLTWSEMLGKLLAHLEAHNEHLRRPMRHHVGQPLAGQDRSGPPIGTSRHRRVNGPSVALAATHLLRTAQSPRRPVLRWARWPGGTQTSHEHRGRPSPLGRCRPSPNREGSCGSPPRESSSWSTTRHPAVTWRSTACTSGRAARRSAMTFRHHARSCCWQVPQWSALFGSVRCSRVTHRLGSNATGSSLARPARRRCQLRSTILVHWL